MNLDETKILPYLKKLLQKDISIEMPDKSAKTGKLLLFKQSGFYVQLTMTHPKKDVEIVEIPYPFAFKTCNNKLVFDYTCNKIAKRASASALIAKLQSPATIKNKFYNTTVTIRMINEE